MVPTTDLMLASAIRPEVRTSLTSRSSVSLMLRNPAAVVLPRSQRILLSSNVTERGFFI